MHILHCHSTFSLGGKEARSVRLMNMFGNAAQHTIVSAVPDALGARDSIASHVRVAFPGDAAPPLTGKPSLPRYRALARYMQQFDLVLTYNWGAMDAVGARRLFPKRCPPLIHHEDGFNADEAARLNWKRNGFRRAMLPAAKAVVVPSRTLEAIALNIWKQPKVRVHRIGNGIDVAAYQGEPAADAIPGFQRRDGEIVIGTLAGLRPVKNLPMLVRAFAALPDHSRLVIVGEGEDRAAIAAEAARCRIADRVLLPGFLPHPHRYLGLFDVFALSSHSEQFPISLVEAMAAGLPAVATDVGDVAAILPDGQSRLVVQPGHDVRFAEALQILANDPGLRNRLGTANREHARSHHDEAAMIAAYCQLYAILD